MLPVCCCIVHYSDVAICSQKKMHAVGDRLDSNQSLLPGCSHLRWRGTESEGRGGSGVGRASSDSAEPDRTKLKLGKHPGQGLEELNNDVVQDRIFPRICGT